jgi:hypothetical protein
VKVLVCGSRKFSDPFHASMMIDAKIASLPLCEVIHGGALGADAIADESAARHGLKVSAFYADWDTHGKKAGIIRNLLMLDQKPEFVLAFWDGSSKGTLHTINEARKRRIPVEIVPLA